MRPRFLLPVAVAVVLATGPGASPAAAAATPSGARSGTSAGASATTAGAAEGAIAAPGRLVVRLVPGADASAVLGSVRPAEPPVAVDPHTWSLAVAPGRVATVTAALALDPAVRSVSPDHLVRAAVVPNDPGVPEQYAITRVDAPTAWDVTLGSAQVVVAVLDTQVDATHPDLAGKLFSGGNFVTGACGPGVTRRAHGTVVAGLVGAATNNGLGIAGIGWNTRVMPLRVLCDDGSGLSSDVARAVRFAADNGAGVLNLSFTTNTNDDVIAEAVAYAQSRGLVVVAAAGNVDPTAPDEVSRSATAPVYPAALPNVVAVAASDQNDLIASFSKRGASWVDVAAPGVSMLSTIPGGGYSRAWSGTSFAAPVVAATAALLVAAIPGITADGILARLQRSADRMAGTGVDVAWGRLNAGKTVSGRVSGYWVASAAGDVVPFGDAPVLGSATGARTSPIVTMAATPTGRGYLLASAAGEVLPFGDAQHFGSMAGRPLNRPVVGIASTTSGRGYWLVASDGGIFAFGDAGFFGSMGGRPLNRPVVGMASSPTGAGYWLVASDGGIFAFGDALFYGSIGGTPINQPVVGLVPSRSGRGYWAVAADGGVFNYGDAPFIGAATGRLASPVVALAPA